MQTARQEMMASLLKHLDSMSGPVYTETDQELFYEDLVSITKAFHELDEMVAKSMCPKLSKIFGSFELKSDQAFGSAVKHSMNAMIALGRQAAGSSVALDVTALIKQAQEACKDQAIRHHFDWSRFGTRLRENSLDETVLQAVMDLRNLQAKSDKFETMVAFLDSLPQFCATLAESRAKSSRGQADPHAVGDALEGQCREDCCSCGAPAPRDLLGGDLRRPGLCKGSLHRRAH